MKAITLTLTFLCALTLCFVGGTAADFISTGHNMNTGQFVSGGFYYGTSAETGSDGKLLNATWLPWSTQNAASPKTEPVSGLTPNTLYYMQTSLTLSSGGSQTSYCSTPIPFVTAPDITQASVSTGTAGGEALVSASFHGGNAPLTEVKIYYDTAPINAGSPASWAAHTCVPLPETSFDSSGFTNFTLAGLVPGQAYNILVVAENDSLTADSGGPILGRDTWALAYRAAYAVTEKHVDVYGNPLNPAVADTQTLVPPMGAYSKLIPAVQGYAVRGYYWGSAFTPPGSPYTPGGAVAADSVESNLTVYFIYGHVANVTISNTLTGDYADKTKSFSFMLCFTNADGSPLPAGTVFGYTGGVLGNAGATAPPNGSVTLDVGGTALLALKDGQTIALKDIPAEYKIRIVETADSNYTVSFTDSAEGLSTPGNDTGLRTMGAQARSFDFVNTRLQVVPSGLAQGGEGPVALLLLAALALLLCLAVVWLVRRRSWTK